MNPRYITSEIQTLPNRRRELTKHGAIEPTTVRNYHGHLARFAQQLEQMSTTLQRDIDDLQSIINRDAAQQ